MIDKEFFQRVVFLVGEETGITRNDILSHIHKPDVVDARYLLVRLLSDIGFSTQYISKVIGHTGRSITYMLTKFDERKNRSVILRKKYETLKKYLTKQRNK